MRLFVLLGKGKKMADVLNNFNDDTIVAIATAMSDAGIGIIRVSGKDAVQYVIRFIFHLIKSMILKSMIPIL